MEYLSALVRGEQPSTRPVLESGHENKKKYYCQLWSYYTAWCLISGDCSLDVFYIGKLQHTWNKWLKLVHALTGVVVFWYWHVLFAKCVWKVVAVVVRKAGVTKGHNSPDRVITAITVRDPDKKKTLKGLAGIQHIASSNFHATFRRGHICKLSAENMPR